MPHLLGALALAQIAGIALADAGWLGAGHAWTVVGVTALVAPWLGRHARGRALAAVALVFAAGVLSLAAPLATARRHPAEQTRDVVAEARVCQRDARTRSLDVVLCEVSLVAPRAGCTGAARPPLPARLRVRADAGTQEAQVLAGLVPGERIRARLRVRRAAGLRNPGVASRARAAERRGLGGHAQLVDPALLVRIAEAGSAPPVPHSGMPGPREVLAGRLQREGSGGALLAALAVGARDALPESAGRALRRLGLSHLLAVSGLHLLLVTGLVFATASALGRRVTRLVRAADLRTGALVTGALAATAYAWLTGFGLPVQRALVFVWLLALGWLTRRPRAAPNALALASLVVLALRPEALFELGAQLSFVATGALLLSLGRTGRGASGPGDAVSVLMATSAVAIAATAPLLAWHGRASSPAALLANGIAVPWTGWVLLPVSLIAAVAAALDPLPGSGAVIGLAAAIGDASLAAVERVAAALPAVAPPPPASLLALVPSALLACVTLRAEAWGVRLAAALAAVLWATALPTTAGGPPPPRIVALDVGQGDAVLLQGRRAAVLLDGGRAVPGRFDLGQSAVLPALRALGVRRLDAVVASHADLDHRGGLAAVVESLPVGALWLPRSQRADPAFAGLRALAAGRGVALREIAAGDAPIVLGDLRLTPLWPPAGDDPSAASRNDRSLVMRAEVGGLRILLTGDAGQAVESALLAGGTDLSAEVLKVAHHGSATGTHPAFLRAVGPRVALVSAPCGGSSGLPDPRVLHRLRAQGARVAWTGRDGAIAVAPGSSPHTPALHAWFAPRRCRPAAPALPPAVGLWSCGAAH